MDIIVGDRVKLISEGCGCEICLTAREGFYEVTVVDDGQIETEVGVFGTDLTWEVLNLVLEND
jgi:hypothetical protein